MLDQLVAVLGVFIQLEIADLHNSIVHALVDSDAHVNCQVLGVDIDILILHSWSSREIDRIFITFFLLIRLYGLLRQIDRVVAAYPFRLLNFFTNCAIAIARYRFFASFSEDDLVNLCQVNFKWLCRLSLR